MPDNWRNQHNILVPGADAIGTIGVIRSLGRAGYRVHAASENKNALGLRSKYTTQSVVVPQASGPQYSAWLNNYIRDHDIEAIVPGGGILDGTGNDYETYAHLFPLHRNREVVERAYSKVAVQEILSSAEAHARGANLNLPPALTLYADRPLPSAADFEALGMPVFAKTDGCTVTLADGTVRRLGAVVKRCDSGADALATVSNLLETYPSVLVQGFVPGKGAGASFVVWDGVVLSRFGNLCLHESPHTGGFCTLRETWQHQEMICDAELKLEMLEWQGVAMLEYRWDEASQRFFFIEINPRFWAALHVALYSNVDMPRILMDAFFNRPNDAEGLPEKRTRVSYTFPGEVAYVSSRLKDRSLSIGSRMWSVIEFFVNILDPRVTADLNFPGDRLLYWRRLWQFLKTGA